MPIGTLMIWGAYWQQETRSPLSQRETATLGATEATGRLALGIRACRAACATG